MTTTTECSVPRCVTSHERPTTADTGVAPALPSTPARPRLTDKSRLSAERPYRDTSDVAGNARRTVRALGRRIAKEDPEDLCILLDLEAAVVEAQAVAVAGLRRSGFSDGEIGVVFDPPISKQAVAQRFPHETGER